MTNTLFTPPMPELTGRQALAYRMCAGEGATDMQVGTALHVAKGCEWCIEGPLCKYAAQDGLQVLKALRAKELVVRRKTSLWQHRNPEPTNEPARELPESF